MCIVYFLVSEKSLLKLTSFLDEDKLTSHRSSSFRDARLGGDLPDDSGAPGGGVQRLVRLRQRQAKKSFNLGKDGRFLENTSCSEVNEFVFFGHHVFKVHVVFTLLPVNMS